MPDELSRIIRHLLANELLSDIFNGAAELMFALG